MVLELATLLLGAVVGVVAVLYAAPRGYFGHRKTKSNNSITSLESFTPAVQPTIEPVIEAHEPEPPAEPEPTPLPAPAFYETVQPAPAPVTYTPPPTTSFGAPSIAKKSVHTYRRRTAPVRSGLAPKSGKPKQKKR